MDLNRRIVEDQGLAGTVADVIEPVLEELGFRLVQVRITGERGQTVQIMAERPDGSLSIEDCTSISRGIAPVLDAHDPIKGAYHLEVSSPGIDRPLVRGCDFENWVGFEAKVELAQQIDGRRRFRGVIDGFVDGEARLLVALKEGEDPVIVGLTPEMIERAKLVMSDDLLKMASKAQGRDDTSSEDVTASS